MTKKLKFPQFPNDPHYFRCCGVGQIKIYPWLNTEQKYEDQKGTYYFTREEKNERT